ncbi:endoplasmic reticulum resident protein 44 isoform X2 [Frankliniella occidentalis]|uniref:Endoplasmic reticulum resident protein 44 isoform X2 n=1 Tax=Frankliniella occidentalis TaxID=133901 RepID=A0A9C6U0G0_FRAOC|nr:endoplasmic reticulum resident protein 44 isoform X2 [Frankliniella occidentalis]
MIPNLTSRRLLILLHIWLSYLFYNPADSGAVQLSASNIDSTLASNELVFINFYADWCRFSNMLAPVFDEAADKVTVEFPTPGRVVMGKVDCDKEGTLASRFHITKYPTLKLFQNGQPAKREYRGQRSVDAFVSFVKKQLEDPTKEFSSLKDLENLDEKKRMLIGYFDRRDNPDFNTFRRVATNLKDDCQFHVGFGPASEQMHPPGQSIVVFRPDKATSNEHDETFMGDIRSYDELNIWAAEKCVPLVREITFENAEELTEEGLPFLILFHKADDTESIKKYKDVINKELIGEKHSVNFLTADGGRFSHPLHHLGMSQSDLPLIAIDSFRHMYLFPKFEDMEIPGKLRQFLLDLYSGKLHREFHYGPDTPAENTVELIAGSVDKKPTSPPESSFKKLAPSKNRYTLLRDEL